MKQFIRTKHHGIDYHAVHAKWEYDSDGNRHYCLEVENRTYTGSISVRNVVEYLNRGLGDMEMSLIHAKLIKEWWQ